MNYKVIPLGFIESPQDIRDYTLETFGISTEEKYPSEFVVENIPEIHNQGPYGMCVAFSLAAIKESQELKERNKRVRYSPGFIYGNRNGMYHKGEGMVPREALKALKQDGVCPFVEYPVQGTYPTCSTQIGSIDFEKQAKPQRVLSYLRIYNSKEVKKALMSLGPVLLAAKIYENFYENENGVIEEPAGKKLGGHAMTIIGWKKINDLDYYIVNNSWGKNWGDNGRCYIKCNSLMIKEIWAITDLIPNKAQEELKKIELYIDSDVYTVNGAIKKMNTRPFIQDQRTFVPVRFIAEELGCEVFWDGERQKVTIIKGMN